jgi:hypothetical protein
MYAAGIDPGLGGAFCVVEGVDGKVHVRVLRATPTTWTLVSKKARRIYDVDAMWKLMQAVDVPSMALVCIEKQAPRKLDGKVATFSTGFGYGLWRAMLVAVGAPHRIVEPRAWRSVLGIPKLQGKAGKHAIRDVVSQRIPDADVTLATADAIALALAALTTYTPPPA